MRLPVAGSRVHLRGYWALETVVSNSGSCSPGGTDTIVPVGPEQNRTQPAGTPLFITRSAAWAAAASLAAQIFLRFDVTPLKTLSTVAARLALDFFSLTICRRRALCCLFRSLSSSTVNSSVFHSAYCH